MEGYSEKLALQGQTTTAMLLVAVHSMVRGPELHSRMQSLNSFISEVEPPMNNSKFSNIPKMKGQMRMIVMEMNNFYEGAS
jgi:hypothetical protein